MPSKHAYTTAGASDGRFTRDTEMAPNTLQRSTSPDSSEGSPPYIDEGALTPLTGGKPSFAGNEYVTVPATQDKNMVDNDDVKVNLNVVDDGDADDVATSL